MLQFELNDHEYIELNKLLKLLNLVSTGGESNLVITNGEVLVNGETEFQKRKKLRKADTVSFGDNYIKIV